MDKKFVNSVNKNVCNKGNKYKIALEFRKSSQANIYIQMQHQKKLWNIFKVNNKGGQWHGVVCKIVKAFDC